MTSEEVMKRCLSQATPRSPISASRHVKRHRPTTLQFRSILTFEDGFLICASSTSSDGDAVGNHGLSDMLLVKTDNAGNTIWSRCYGGSQSDGGLRVIASNAGGSIIVGQTSSNDGDLVGNNPYYAEPVPSTTGWVMKVDAEGDIIWQRCVGGLGNEFLYDVKEAQDGSIWAVGYTNSNNGDVTGNQGGGDAWIVKLNGAGELIGTKCFGGTAHDRFGGINVLPSGNAIVVGRTISADGDISDPLGGLDVWVVCVSSDLEVIWQRTMGGSTNDLAEGIAPASDGSVVITGYSQSSDGDLTGNHGEADVWVVKLAPWEVGIAEHGTPQALHLYPSPVQDHLQVEWEGPHAAVLHWTIVDLTGRPVAQGRSAGGRWSVPVAHLAPGTYVMWVHGPRGMSGGRFVKE
ncbi:MAG: hypothetical protein KIT10_08175 [Flavobacteriales bacterium]|nr:hypothetical protein [Flavobacteriales bacterium]